MTRLMLYTFQGPNRSGDGTRSHLHEAPWGMTGPLVVLGALTAVGGAINLPTFAGGGASLARWLAPVTAPAVRLAPLPELSGGVEWLLIILGVATAALGIGGAYYLLKPAALVPAREAAPERGFGRLLARKYYVDEIYNALIVRPLVWTAELCWRVVDRGLIDGVAVTGVARATQALGWLGSQLQTGELGMYVVLFMVGVVLLLGAALR